MVQPSLTWLGCGNLQHSNAGGRVVDADFKKDLPWVDDPRFNRYQPESQMSLGPSFPRHASLRDEPAMDIAATRVRETWLQRFDQSKATRACGNASEKKAPCWRDSLHLENERLPAQTPTSPTTWSTAYTNDFSLGERTLIPSTRQQASGNDKVSLISLRRQ